MSKSVALIDTCFLCRKERPVRRSQTLEKVLLCQLCQQKLDNTVRCAYCNEPKPVVFRDEKKRPVCQACWRREFNLTRPEVKARPKSIGRAVQCAFCPAIAPAQYRTHDGQAVCAKCYKKHFYVYPMYKCIDCGRDRKAAKWLGPGKTRPLCHTCYRRMKVAEETKARFLVSRKNTGSHYKKQ